MKKIISAFLAIILSLTLVACNVIKEKSGIVNNVDGEIKSSYVANKGFFSSKSDEAPMAAKDFDASLTGDATDGEYYAKDEQTQINAGVLTAGEFKDLNNREEWVEFISQKSNFDIAKSWKLNTVKMIKVSVLSDDKIPQKNLKVSLLGSNDSEIFNAVTDMNGNAYLFYNIATEQDAPKKIVCRSNGGDEVSVDYEGADVVDITLNGNNAQTKLDLLFMVDTTGSMGDELEYLKEELKYVVENVGQKLDVSIRTSVNFYRDEGDQYVVRYFGFKDDINEAVKNISEQSSAGGGDYPEAVHTALDNAINGHAWSEDVGTVKLMFLVLDAPPHDDNKVKSSIYSSIISAAKKGIRIIPVASSGVDITTEILCRSMAILTGGTYTFLTNDSGIGGDHLVPSVSSYQVEKLNDLMIRIISEYCA